ncbi:DHA2 family efflux MFS transporter permease subunit [Nocardia sp. NPDC057227]|uniref:DHA2 family efflux MFS transporter permease subunit n=1 Tax=Nocardia sp. NPDC057227 TaxID=3346056 RepID=UPI00363A1360
MPRSAAHRWSALGAMALAMTVIGLDMTVLTVALPTLAIDLGAGSAALQWFSTAYTLALAAVLLPAGALGDRYGRRSLLLGALLLFGLASVACAYADSPGQLIAARTVLGIAAAAMIPMTMATVTVLFADPAERARAMSIWVTATAIGLPLGPILGGWLLTTFWWGSVFLINVPVVLIGMAAVAALVPESRDPGRRPIDLPGTGLSVAGMLALTYGLIRLGEDGLADPLGWLGTVAGAALLVALVYHQRRAAYPLADLELFRRSGFRWGSVFAVVITFGLFGLFFTLPQYYRAVLEVDALGSGLRLLPLIAGLLAGSRAGDALRVRFGTARTVGLGLGLLGLGLGLGACTSVASGFGFVALWVALTGAGMGTALPAAMAAALDDLAGDRAGAGSALIQALRQAAGTIAVAFLGAVLAAVYRSELGAANRPPVDESVNTGVAVARQLGDAALLERVQAAFVAGMGVMLALCALLCLVAAPVALRVLPGRAAPRLADPSESGHGR